MIANDSSFQQVIEQLQDSPLRWKWSHEPLIGRHNIIKELVEMEWNKCYRIIKIPGKDVYRIIEKTAETYAFLKRFPYPKERAPVYQNMLVQLQKCNILCPLMLPFSDGSLIRSGFAKLSVVPGMPAQVTNINSHRLGLWIEKICGALCSVNPPFEWDPIIDPWSVSRNNDFVSRYGESVVKSAGYWPLFEGSWVAMFLSKGANYFKRLHSTTVLGQEDINPTNVLAHESGGIGLVDLTPDLVAAEYVTGSAWYWWYGANISTLKKNISIFGGPGGDSLKELWQNSILMASIACIVTCSLIKIVSPGHDFGSFSAAKRHRERVKNIAAAWPLLFAVGVVAQAKIDDAVAECI